jgi:hypothetical protein
MKVTQNTSGANALGAWGQTGANTANFVRSSLQSEGLLGGAMSPSYAGPFRKSARSCHWCYFSCSGTMCSTTGGLSFTKIKIPLVSRLLGHLFPALLSQNSLAIYLQAFPPRPKFLVWLICLLASPSLRSCPQVPL